ncbi:MAG TPA: HAMP domain-containing sensor histidine kinase [Longimicrobiales bacterium]|nr:HAMP domain-containing sensor histidine kinase [Longimicrobiales bacterium]
MSDLPDIRPADLRANRLDLISRLADDLAHEIKNPLNSMVVNLELVRRLTATDRADAVDERVHILEGAVQRVHTLVAALLNAVRPQDDEDPADTTLVLLDVRPLLEARAHLAHVDLAFEGDEGGRVAVPAHELAQVLLNLVDNAMDAVGQGGRIRVVTAAGPDTVSLRVEDSGPGLPDEVRNRPGFPRRTARAHHAGLGLPVCLWLLGRRRGSMDVDARGTLGGAAVQVTLRRAGPA